MEEKENNCITGTLLEEMVKALPSAYSKNEPWKHGWFCANDWKYQGAKEPAKWYMGVAFCSEECFQEWFEREGVQQFEDIAKKKGITTHGRKQTVTLLEVIHGLKEKDKA